MNSVHPYGVSTVQCGAFRPAHTADLKVRTTSTEDAPVDPRVEWLPAGRAEPSRLDTTPACGGVPPRDRQSARSRAVPSPSMMSACESFTSPRAPRRESPARLVPTIRFMTDSSCVQRNPGAARDVDHLAGRLRRLARAQHAVDDVGDVGEVAGLLAVAVDRRPAALDAARSQTAR